MAIRRFPPKVRRALSRGAVGQVGRRLHRGFSLGSIVSFLAETFGLTRPQDAEPVLDLGTQSEVAGQAILQAAPGESVPATMVPLNPFLPSAVTEGGRVVHEVIVPWVDEGTGIEGEFFWRVPSDDVLTAQELSDMAAEFLSFMAGYDPSKFKGVDNPSQVTIGDIREVHPQRSF